MIPTLPAMTRWSPAASARPDMFDFLFLDKDGTKYKM